MITVSVCMIVKNEEKILRTCLDSLKGLYEELIIVDTGSTDSTKEIAGEYTDKVYDFQWIDDFSAARNFSMSKATCDYIYVADADEEIDEANRRKFKLLKAILDPQIEIVEMRYVNQLSNGSVYNFDAEYRPKLFKRLREYKFVDPIHETLRLLPVVYDSEIDIIHNQGEVHAGRDIRIFEKTIKSGQGLSDRLVAMYVRELLLAGTDDNFIAVKGFFEKLSEREGADQDLLRLSYIALAKTAVIEDNTVELMKYSIKDIIVSGSSELCTILGQFYEAKGDLGEASVWYYNAHYETKPEVCLTYNTEIPLKALIGIYEKLGNPEAAAVHAEELKKVSETQ
ncbi:MAG: glycosyltransferase family 2 protein [Lachnospiraceae bacterium]|nr:glycosyltransferase family 2 protein [Lachnospiraceae bacterium]